MNTIPDVGFSQYVKEKFPNQILEPSQHEQALAQYEQLHAGIKERYRTSAIVTPPTMTPQASLLALGALSEPPAPSLPQTPPATNTRKRKTPATATTPRPQKQQRTQPPTPTLASPERNGELIDLEDSTGPTRRSTRKRTPTARLKQLRTGAQNLDPLEVFGQEQHNETSDVEPDDAQTSTTTTPIQLDDTDTENDNTSTTTKRQPRATKPRTTKPRVTKPKSTDDKETLLQALVDFNCSLNYYSLRATTNPVVTLT
eukprot:TRINITY_DN9057_c0_g1_i1.p1 TRINITY_DN9057_c0_g1~~TRINITY_DN9057_c0_g1_i1.p1  ORF type:complete len:291 (-),score=35.46 TRINITY_DN9057_c0_g1_i1:87-857(-)